ncbi:MAG TPA: hypothetical protein VMS21_14945 [Methylomirabilota bacterium]|nr:hypothetical protein [Methylomirabilota bacterium]
MRASTQTTLAASRTGRILLHTFCLIRHPDHARWHWQGILRELHG